MIQLRRHGHTCIGLRSLAAAMRFWLSTVIHSTYLCHSGCAFAVDTVFGASEREPRRDEYVTSVDRRIARRAGRLSSRMAVSCIVFSPEAILGVPIVGSEGYSWFPPSSSSDGIFSLIYSSESPRSDIRLRMPNRTYLPRITKHGIIPILYNPIDAWLL